MNKKLLVLVLLCFFVFLVGIFAGEKEDKGKIIEHLVWETTPPFEVGYDLWIDEGDDEIVTPFESDPFLTFHVPTSPKSEALFFDIETQVNFTWSGFYKRMARIRCYYRFISDVISNDIEVWNSPSIFWTLETNNSLEPATGRDRRVTKDRIRRNSVDHWLVYKSGERVPDDVAIHIINSLIDSGFDVEFWVAGEVQGMRYFNIYPVIFEVTRLSNK